MRPRGQKKEKQWVTLYVSVPVAEICIYSSITYTQHHPHFSCILPCEAVVLSCSLPVAKQKTKSTDGTDRRESNFTIILACPWTASTLQTGKIQEESITFLGVQILADTFTFREMLCMSLLCTPSLEPHSSHDCPTDWLCQLRISPPYTHTNTPFTLCPPLMICSILRSQSQSSRPALERPCPSHLLSAHLPPFHLPTIGKWNLHTKKEEKNQQFTQPVGSLTTEQTFAQHKTGKWIAQELCISGDCCLVILSQLVQTGKSCDLRENIQKAPLDQAHLVQPIKCHTRQQDICNQLSNTLHQFTTCECLESVGMWSCPLAVATSPCALALLCLQLP